MDPADASPPPTGDATPSAVAPLEPPQAPPGAAGLLLDRDPRVREGFARLLGGAGLSVEATDSPDTLLARARDRRYLVAVVDMDTPEPGAGLDVLGRLQDAAPRMPVVMITGRPSFDTAIACFRAGAADVVPRSPESVRYLLQRVPLLCREAVASDPRADLLREALEVHEGFLERLLGASRRAMEAEEAASRGGGEDDAEEEPCAVLVVDADERIGSGLRAALAEEPGFEVQVALTAGEALDAVGRRPPHVALVRRDLPDLPASLVVQGVKAEAPASVLLLYTPPSGASPGRVDVVEGSREIELIPRLSRGEELVDQVKGMSEAYRARLKERRHLARFRRDYYEFLRRYVDLRRRIADHLGDGVDAGAADDLARGR